MMDTVSYYDTTGKILHTYSGLCLDRVDAEHPELSRVDGIHSGKTHYILGGEVTERPASPVTRTGLTLLDVPEGSKLWINGVSYDAAGTVELEFPLPGTYRLRVECFPFLDWNDEVTVPVVSGTEP